MKEKTMEYFTFNIVSPTRGEKYNITDLIGKMWARRNFYFEYEILKLQIPEHVYRDYDGVIAFQSETEESLWTDSLDGFMNLFIPFHVTGEGRADIGSFSTSFTGSHPEDEPEEKYVSYLKKPLECEFAAQNGDNTDKIKCLWGEIPYDIRKQISDLVKEAMFQAAIQEAE